MAPSQSNTTKKAQCHHLPTIAHTPTNTVAAGTVSLGAAAAPQCPNPTYNRPAVGATITAVAGPLHGATNPNSNANNSMGQHPGGESNGVRGPTVVHRTVVVDSFGAPIWPAASIVQEGRDAAAVREAFEAAFGSPAHGGNTDGGEDTASEEIVAQTVAGR